MPFGNKKDKLPIYITTWMNLKCILNERNQSENSTPSMIPFI